MGTLSSIKRAPADMFSIFSLQKGVDHLLTAEYRNNVLKLVHESLILEALSRDHIPDGIR